MTLRAWLCVILSILWPALSGAEAPKVELRRDDAAGRLDVLAGGTVVFSYQYAETLDLPHYWPLNSPSGKSMLVRQTEPYPHHRSFWFADTVRLDGGREISTYNAYYSGRKEGENIYRPPFQDHVRHLKFTRLETKEDQAWVDSELVWEMEGNRPVLSENRHMAFYLLPNGEYFLDLNFTLTAALGEVLFISDDVHYAWPYLRLETRWSGEITADTGATGQEATNMKVAKWIDYSNTVEAETAGVAVFQWPDGKDHRWLTREYGCFGPRRPDDRSGKSFVLKKGESITQRVGILVHAGDVKSARVAERYQKYVEGGRVR